MIKEQITAVPRGARAIDTNGTPVQELITLRSLYVEEALQQEVEAPATPRKARAEGQPEVVRHGKPPNSTDQKLLAEAHRLRDSRRNQGVPPVTSRQQRAPPRVCCPACC